MKKIFIVLVICCFVLNSGSLANAQEVSTETQVDQLLGSLSSLERNLRRDKRNRPLSKQIKAIKRKIIRAVNSLPPDNCLAKLRIAMDDFFALVSDLEIGVSCAPPVLPPFLKSMEPVTIDCIPPPEEELSSDQLGAYGEVLPVYNSARDVFHIDTNENEIPDACEGEIE